MSQVLCACFVQFMVLPYLTLASLVTSPVVTLTSPSAASLPVPTNVESDHQGSLYADSPPKPTSKIDWSNSQGFTCLWLCAVSLLSDDRVSWVSCQGKHLISMSPTSLTLTAGSMILHLPMTFVWPSSPSWSVCLITCQFCFIFSEPSLPYGTLNPKLALTDSTQTASHWVKLQPAPVSRLSPLYLVEI